MNREIKYSKKVSSEHTKKWGQYFTNPSIADFMCAWACKYANNMLDPAVGNSIFFLQTKKYNSKCILSGYELDKKVLDYFGNPAKAFISNADYLTNDWKGKYDAIVCNPPYNKFQAVLNRHEILKNIYAYTGIKYSGYTNLYILFLIKSIFQLSDRGRLAYIIPSEFLNAKYGTPVKQLLLDRRLLRAIINFQDNKNIFFNATTTCCILLLDREEKDSVAFYNLSSLNSLKQLDMNRKNEHCIYIKYKSLQADKKWRAYLNQEDLPKYENLKNLSQYCFVSRGIATGANDFFCFSPSKALQYNIPMQCLAECICRSADIKTAFFTKNSLKQLAAADKKVYILDADETKALLIKDYIKLGEQNGIPEKYLPSRRKPWFSMERKSPAPILVSSAFREKIKFIRNLAGIKSLSTFHSVFVREKYEKYTDLIFCYFLTPIAQEIICKNRKELGNKLNKFQPNDLNTAKMLNPVILSAKDKKRILKIYSEMQLQESDTYIKELNQIFSYYILGKQDKIILPRN